MGTISVDSSPSLLLSLLCEDGRDDDNDGVERTVCVVAAACVDNVVTATAA